MKHFNIAKARHEGADIYELLIKNAQEPYGYDDMVHAYWNCAHGTTKCELGEVFRGDPAREHMIKRMQWLNQALLQPKSLLVQLPLAMYGKGFETQEDPESIMPRLQKLDTSTNGRMWHDVLEWLRMEWELQDGPLALWEAWGDRCGHPACEPVRGCQHCQRYRCWGCKKVFYWDDGGTDTELCDTCWCKREAECAEVFGRECADAMYRVADILHQPGKL